MKPINLIFDIKRDMHDYVELMQGYSYSFECEFYDDGIEFDLTGYNMSVDMLLANGDYDFRVNSKVVSGNKITFNTDVVSDYTGDAKLQILLEKSGVYTGSWLINCNVKPSVLNEVKNTDFVTDLKQTIQEGKDLYDKGGVATKQDIADVNTQLSDLNTEIEYINKNDFVIEFNKMFKTHYKNENTQQAKTDNTIALTQALNLLISKGYGVLKFSGVYHFSNDEVYVGYKQAVYGIGKCIIDGQGSKFYVENDTKNFIRFDRDKLNVGKRLFNLTIKDLEIVGVNIRNGIGLKFDGAFSCLFSNLSITGFDTCMKLYSASECYFEKIILGDCRIGVHGISKPQEGYIDSDFTALEFIQPIITSFSECGILSECGGMLAIRGGSFANPSSGAKSCIKTTGEFRGLIVDNCIFEAQKPCLEGFITSSCADGILARNIDIRNCTIQVVLQPENTTFLNFKNIENIKIDGGIFSVEDGVINVMKNAVIDSCSNITFTNCSRGYEFINDVEIYNSVNIIIDNFIFDGNNPYLLKTGTSSDGTFVLGIDSSNLNKTGSTENDRDGNPLYPCTMVGQQLERSFADEFKSRGKGLFLNATIKSKNQTFIFMCVEGNTTLGQYIIKNTPDKIRNFIGYMPSIFLSKFSTGGTNDKSIRCLDITNVSKIGLLVDDISCKNNLTVVTDMSSAIFSNMRTGDIIVDYTGTQYGFIFIGNYGFKIPL